MARTAITMSYRGGSGQYQTLYLNTDSLSYATLYTASSGGTAVPGLLPTRRGYKFINWYYSVSTGPGFYDDYPVSSGSGIFSGSSLREFVTKILSLESSPCLYANWEAYQSHTLTLDTQGGSVSPSSIQATCTLELGSLPTPSRIGYRFEGWFKDPTDASEPVTASTGYWQDKDGTIYAHWTENPKHTLTLDPNGGTVSPPSVQFTEGLPIGVLPDPAFAPNRFLGWYTASTGGTRIEPTDIFEETTDQTVYAHWEAPYTLTFNPTGGATSEVSRSVFTGDVLGNLPQPAKSGCFFDGWWTDDVGGEEITSETTYVWTTDLTVYAHWTLDEQWNLTFAANGGTVSPASKRVRPGNPVGELPTPEYDGREFLGWFTQPSGGTQYTDATVFDLHQDLTLFAHWFRYKYALRFDPNGGMVDETERTVTINEPIGELPEPTKYANTFIGWFTSREGGEQWDEDTVFENTDDTTVYAHWETDPQYARTISLNAEGGTVSPSTLSCTYGLPIESLPIPVNYGKIFLGWFTAASGGTRYSSGTTCDWSGTLTLHARWTDDVFGNLTDWFGLETANGPLMLVASTDGATRSVTETSHSGALAIQTADSSVGAFERGGILLNPTCTYRISKNGTVQIQLGKAWAKTGTVRSGYMIVSAEYATESDGEPVLVVRGAANEGADAINRWNVNLSVNPDHIAQDPMNAVSGGGELTECKTLITCDPVVPMENGMPCASDVVHGKVVVTATTNAYFGETAPTAAGSFVETNGEPNSETDVDFTSYAFMAERSL